MYKAYYCMLPAKIQQHFVKKDISVITHHKNQLVRRCVTLNVTAMSLSTYVWHKSLEFLARLAC